jgi:hypothetical protein
VFVWKGLKLVISVAKKMNPEFEIALVIASKTGWF